MILLPAMLLSLVMIGCAGQERNPGDANNDQRQDRQLEPRASRYA